MTARVILQAEHPDEPNRFVDVTVYSTYTDWADAMECAANLFRFAKRHAEATEAVHRVVVEFIGEVNQPMLYLFTDGDCYGL